MFVRLMWALGIILLLAVVVVLGISAAYTMRTTTSPTPFPTPHPTPLVPSPLPTTTLTGTPATPSAATTFQGTIIGIGSHPVAYKNSTILTVQEKTGTTMNVYVNTDTGMTDANNNIIDLPQLSDGMSVVVKGKPIEGGIEASTLKVQSAL